MAHHWSLAQLGLKIAESKGTLTLEGLLTILVLSALGGAASVIFKDTLAVRFILREEPDTSIPFGAFLENISLWLVWYGSLYLFFDVLGPHVPFIRKRKFEASYTKSAMVMKEIRRSIVCVLVLSLMELLMERAKPWSNAAMVAEPSPLNVAIAIALLEQWADAHFYSQHRLMHIGALYPKVHKVHHESINPNVFSGLSFHPLEGCIYFSLVLIPFLVPMPYWAWRMLKLSSLLFPAGGHCGHGWQHTDWHYMHHKTTVYNFGNTRVIDAWGGTDLQLSRASKAAAANAATKSSVTNGAAKIIDAPKKIEAINARQRASTPPGRRMVLEEVVGPATRN